MNPTRSMLFFEAWHNRAELSVGLVARSGFRLGAGKSLDAIETDLPVLRLEDDRLVVPGSSIKGVIRSAAERHLRSAAPPEEVSRWACDPLDSEAQCLHGIEGAARKAADPIREMRKLIRERVCHACATFGGMGLASHVGFTDTLVTAPSRVRDGVGMDRDLGRAADGIKYDYEVVDPGVRLDVRVALSNVEEWQVGLLLRVIDDIHFGYVRIGGFGSRGLGRFELADGSPTLTWTRGGPPEALDQPMSGPSLEAYRRAAGALLGD